MTEDTDVVSGEFKRMPRLPIRLTAPAKAVRAKWQLLKPKQKLLSGVVIVAVVLAIVGGVFLLVRHLHNPYGNATYVPSVEEYFKNELTNATNNMPDSSASISEKTAHLDNLRNLRAETGDYQGAIAAFMERQSLSTQGLDHTDYYRLASYYYKLGDKQKAVAALDKSWEVAPKTADETTGYNPEVLHQRLEDIKKGYQQ